MYIYCIHIYLYLYEHGNILLLSLSLIFIFVPNIVQNNIIIRVDKIVISNYIDVQLTRPAWVLLASILWSKYKGFNLADVFQLIFSNTICSIQQFNNVDVFYSDMINSCYYNLIFDEMELWCIYFFMCVTVNRAPDLQSGENVFEALLLQQLTEDCSFAILCHI